MKNMVILVSSLLFSTSIFAVKPTADSLFRNLSNADVEDKTVVATFSIKKVFEDKSEFFLNKFYYESRLVRDANICQLNFARGISDATNIDEIKCFKENTIIKDASFKQKLFYSLLDFSLVNSSQLLIKSLKSIGSTIKTNQELLNKAKTFYLYQKKKYLESNKEGDNPLVSDNKEKMAQIESIMSQSYLKEDPIVKRVKSGKDFYWKIEDEKFSATFDHINNKLLRLSIKDETGLQYKLIFKNYISMHGAFEHPELIEISNDKNEQYEIRIKSVQLIDDNSSAFTRRIENLKKKINESGTSISKIELMK